MEIHENGLKYIVTANDLPKMEDFDSGFAAIAYPS